MVKDDIIEKYKKEGLVIAEDTIKAVYTKIVREAIKDVAAATDNPFDDAGVQALLPVLDDVVLARIDKIS